MKRQPAEFWLVPDALSDIVERVGAQSDVDPFGEVVEPKLAGWDYWDIVKGCKGPDIFISGGATNPDHFMALLDDFV